MDPTHTNLFVAHTVPCLNRLSFLFLTSYTKYVRHLVFRKKNRVSFRPQVNTLEILNLIHVLTVMNSSLSNNKKLYVRFQASAAKNIRIALFWVIAQGVVVISYLLFGTTYRSLIQESRFLTFYRFVNCNWVDTRWL